MKTLKFILKVGCALISLTIFISPLFAQKYDKFVDKVNVAYESGDYVKAKKNNVKFRKKVTKKLGSQNNYVVEYYLMTARNDLAVGSLVSFNLNYLEAVSLSEKVNTAQSAEHILVLNRVSNMLLQNGNPQQAASYIKLAQDYVDKIENNQDVKAFTDLNSAAVYSSQGFYAKAIAFISESEKYFSSRAINKETKIDDKTGNLKTVKLSEKETATRLDDYARLMNLKANTYRRYILVTCIDSDMIKH